ncbi:MAG: F0F1 ATP synthase subunit A [Gemmatimonadota bacterium]|nr:F0F1 ATP synthase subunit A [Gemmatimonadota bacterium]
MKFASVLLSLSLIAVVAGAQSPPRPRPAPAVAQQPVGQRGDHAMSESSKNVDIIMPHITDSHQIEYPFLCGHPICESELPRWKPVHIGGMTVDLSPTKHVVMMIIAALLCCVALLMGAHSQSRHQQQGRAPRGFSGMMEAMVLYIRNEVIVPGVGPHGEAYHPFLLSLFFFILFANLLGLLPFGSTATGNVAVTATLAVLSFIVIEAAGMRALGWGYVKTIVYWPDDMPIYGKIMMTTIMTPVEFIGKFTKPFALAIRLFANMTAGHVMVLALISMVFAFGWLIGLAPVVMAVAISMLELFVAFLQAYVFTLLSASFIGQIRTAHH